MTTNDTSMSSHYWDGFSDGRNGLSAVSDHPEYVAGWHEGRAYSAR